MMDKIDELLDELENLVETAQPAIFKADKVSIDRDRALDLINDLRVNIPQEVKQARLITFDSDRIVKEAEAKAEGIVRKAETRAKDLVASDSITKEAKQKAIELLGVAQNKSKEIKGVTGKYVDNMLADTEKFYATCLQDVKRRRQEINNTKK